MIGRIGVGFDLFRMVEMWENGIKMRKNWVMGVLI